MKIDIFTHLTEREVELRGIENFDTQEAQYELETLTKIPWPSVMEVKWQATIMDDGMGQALISGAADNILFKLKNPDNPDAGKFEVIASKANGWHIENISPDCSENATPGMLRPSHVLIEYPDKFAQVVFS